MTDLLPCPFCPSDKSDPKLLNPAEFMHYVKCCSCGCMSGPVCSSEEQAVDNWNTRAVPICRMVFDHPEKPYHEGKWTCSGCGAWWMYPPYDMSDAGYCPHCGRKVVEP